MPLRVITFFLAHHNLFWLPVSLVTSAKASYIVEAATVERIAKFTESLFQILIGCFVSA